MKAVSIVALCLIGTLAMGQDDIIKVALTDDGGDTPGVKVGVDLLGAKAKAKEDKKGIFATIKGAVVAGAKKVKANPGKTALGIGGAIAAYEVAQHNDWLGLGSKSHSGGAEANDTGAVQIDNTGGTISAPITITILKGDGQVHQSQISSGSQASFESPGDRGSQ